MTGNSSNAKIIMVFAAVALIWIVLIYLLNIGETQDITYAANTTTSSTSTTATTSTSAPPTTMPALPSQSSSTTLPSAPTSTTTSTTVTSTTLSTTTTIPLYLQKYSGKGYHQAIMEITFFCPSCVPAVAENLRRQPGYVARDMSYRQKMSWIIYDPRKISLDRILMIAGGNGAVTLFSDEEI